MFNIKSLQITVSIAYSFNDVLCWNGPLLNCAKTKGQSRGWEGIFAFSFVNTKKNANLSSKRQLLSSVLVQSKTGLLKETCPQNSESGYRYTKNVNCSWISEKCSSVDPTHSPLPGNNSLVVEIFLKFFTNMLCLIGEVVATGGEKFQARRTRWIISPYPWGNLSSYLVFWIS